MIIYSIRGDAIAQAIPLYQKFYTQELPMKSTSGFSVSFSNIRPTAYAIFMDKKSRGTLVNAAFFEKALRNNDDLVILEKEIYEI